VLGHEECFGTKRIEMVMYITSGWFFEKGCEYPSYVLCFQISVRPFTLSCFDQCAIYTLKYFYVKQLIASLKEN
jgi:hypothetical protein